MFLSLAVQKKTLMLMYPTVISGDFSCSTFSKFRSGISLCYEREGVSLLLPSPPFFLICFYEQQITLLRVSPTSQNRSSSGGRELIMLLDAMEVTHRKGGSLLDSCSSPPSLPSLGVSALRST